MIVAGQQTVLPLGVGTACRKFNPVWFLSLIATGGKTADSPSDDFPWSDNNGYFEWNKGTYGDALFYFGGEENYLGQAHSVNNLSYNSFYYKLELC